MQSLFKPMVGLAMKVASFEKLSKKLARNVFNVPQVSSRVWHGVSPVSECAHPAPYDKRLLTTYSRPKVFWPPASVHRPLSTIEETMKEAGGDVQVCVATLDDRDSVLAIDPGPGYQGIDYLPDTFASHVQGPNTTGFLVKKAGKVIGFVSAMLVDGGETLFFSTARILSEHRDKGLLTLFRNSVCREFPGSSARRVTMILNQDTMEKLQKSTLQTHDVVVQRSESLYFLGSQPATKTPCDQESKADVEGVVRIETENDLGLILAEAGRTLFPDNRIIIEKRPFRAMVENAAPIFEVTSNPAFLISTPGSHSPSAVAVGDICGKITEGAAFSCGSYFNVELGVWYIVDLYGKEYFSDDLKKHIEWHLLRLQDVAGPGKGILCLAFSRQLHPELAEVSRGHPRLDLQYRHRTKFQLETEDGNVA